jgi:hypothetical protein
MCVLLLYKQNSAITNADVCVCVHATWQCFVLALADDDLSGSNVELLFH